VTRLPQGVVASLGDRSITYEDIVLAGMLGDEWNELVAWSAAGVLQQADGAEVSGEVRRTAEQFRRDRRLEAGDALRAWLAAREITVPEWESHVARRVALSKDSGRTERPVVVPELNGVLRVDGFCNRFWELGANRVLEWMAAQRLVGDAPVAEIDVSQIVEATLADRAAGLADKGAKWCEEHLAILASLSEAHSRLAGMVGTDQAIQGVIDAHWGEWSHLHLDVCRLLSEPAAREALTCAIDDGDSPAVIARRAHTEVERQVVRAEGLESGVLPILLSTPIDEPTGPFRIGSDWLVMWVRERQPADPSDPLVRSEAVEVLVRAAVDRELRGVVTWSAPV
jgi:hypothetical protein